MFKRRFTHVQVIALGFALMILAGALLLMLPISSKDHVITSFNVTFFTATSASCVCGLILKDTFTYWSLFGQLVILVMIQIGGLGFMTIATFFSMIARRKIGLREREIMNESINGTHVGGIVRRMKQLFIRSMIVELTGALLLMVRFIPRFGLFQGIYFSIFHSISAFCNAGFDLMGGTTGAFSSFTGYAGDWYVSLILIFLILIGGLGFLTWEDLIQYRLKFRRYHLYTKIVLSMTLLLVLVPTLLFLLFEWNATGAGLPFSEKLITALFDAVTPRTAGFNTVDTASLSNSGKLLTVLLMFIGGNSGSTAGGIKISTVVVIALYTLTGIVRKKSVHIFGRSLEEDSLKKATAVLFTNLALAIFGAMLICAFQILPLDDVLFETFSAIGTVGMSTGLTRELCIPSCYVIALLMFCGRVGSVSFASALLERPSKPPITYPKAVLIIG